MGLVTDVFWTCPGCGSRQQAQAYGDSGDPAEFPVDAVPSGRYPLYMELKNEGELDAAIDAALAAQEQAKP